MDVVVEMKVALVTCWYKDISMANYSSNLQGSTGGKVDWDVVSSHCGCCKRYSGRKDFLQGECRFVSFPRYMSSVEAASGHGPIQKMLSMYSLFLQFLRGVAYLAKCKNDDIIHYQLSSSQSFGVCALFGVLSVPSEKKRVVTVHSIDPMNKFSFFGNLYKKADMVLVHSEEMKQKMISYAVPENKIRVVPHGARLPPLSGAARKEVTFFGSPTKTKGFWTVIGALKALKDQNKPLKLHIYGIYSVAERNEAVKAASQAGVADLLVWGNRLTEAEFDRKIQESIFTLAVNAIPVSGSSVVTRAMANGTPIIASRIGGIPEYLGDAGLLVPPSDPAALASAMEKLLEDTSLREKFSAEARKKAEGFSWDKVAEMTACIYEECLLKD